MRESSGNDKGTDSERLNFTGISSHWTSTRHKRIGKGAQLQKLYLRVEGCPILCLLWDNAVVFLRKVHSGLRACW